MSSPATSGATAQRGGSTPQRYLAPSGMGGLFAVVIIGRLFGETVDLRVDMPLNPDWHGWQLAEPMRHLRPERPWDAQSMGYTDPLTRWVLPPYSGGAGPCEQRLVCAHIGRLPDGNIVLRAMTDTHVPLPHAPACVLADDYRALKHPDHISRAAWALDVLGITQ